MSSIRQKRRNRFVARSGNILNMEKEMPTENKEFEVEKHEKTRKLFEEKVFMDYYVRSIVRNPDQKPRICGALDFVPGKIENMDEFLKKDDNGNYIRQDVSAMWHGWCLLMKCLPSNTNLVSELMKTNLQKQEGLDEGLNEGYNPSTGHKDEIEFHY